jgi:hypothetical protein
MSAEARFLRRARRMLVIEIEAGLADADHQRVRGQLDQAVRGALPLFLRLVGVHAHGTAHIVVAGGDGLDPIELGEFGADRYHAGHAGRPCAGDDLIQVAILGQEVQMTVGIDEHHGSRSTEYDTLCSLPGRCN